MISLSIVAISRARVVLCVRVRPEAKNIKYEHCSLCSLRYDEGCVVSAAACGRQASASFEISPAQMRPGPADPRLRSRDFCRASVFFRHTRIFASLHLRVVYSGTKTHTDKKTSAGDS